MAEGRIVIDPGHGGTSETGGSSWNNAVSASGVPEKVMTLQLAFRVKRARSNRPKDTAFEST